MNCNASSAAAGSTIWLSEPSRNTTAWSTASKSGFTPSSEGISGNTAAPSGTELSASSAISTSGHGRDDTDYIAIFDGGRQVVEVTDILIIEINIDEAADLAVL